MTTEEIIELAIQGHASTRDAIRWAIEQEREECAKLAFNARTYIQAAKAIRARGEK